jgi:hypothetical protein
LCVVDLLRQMMSDTPFEEFADYSGSLSL